MNPSRQCKIPVPHRWLPVVMRRTLRGHGLTPLKGVICLSGSPKKFDLSLAALLICACREQRKLAMFEPKTPLILPFMGPFYDRFVQPLAFVVLRVLVGGLLAFEGWPKIVAPFAMTGFVEGLGLYPGWFWSAFLAAIQFVGGLMIMVGFLTRPAALANGLMLLVTLWFHLENPYGAALLSPEGMTSLADNQALFTADGLRNFGADGGAKFLSQVQSKAEGFSALWAVGALFFAAFGGGPLSVDRTLLKKEF